MYHRRPQSKTGWPSLNVVIFPPVLRLVVDDPKEWPHRIFTSQSWQDGWISSKSIAGKLGISRERVGSIIHEDLYTRKLYAMWVPKCLNAYQKRQRRHSSEQIWNFFRRDPIISCRNWWPWKKPGYITMTRRQSNNQWSGGIATHPAPKNSECKNLLKSSRLNFLGSRWHPSHWLSSKGLNYQCRVLLIVAGATEGHFEGKTLQEGHQGGLVLTRQCPGSPGTCNQKKQA